MKKLVSIICVLIVVMTISGCKVGLYMEDFKDVQWNCTDIELQFTYSSDNPEMAVGTIVKEDEKIDIICIYTANKSIWIFNKAEYESTIGDEVCEPLLIGSCTIKDDTAMVTIIRDNLYCGEYLDKEIELTKTPLK